MWQELLKTTLTGGNKKTRREKSLRVLINAGNDLLSHTVTRAVPSALKGLTTVFGMGTGVAPSLESPAI
jgi:hypothetical protein